MFREKKWQFDWGEFIAGICFLIIAYVVFARPKLGLSTIVIVFAIAAIIRGIVWLSGFSKLRKETGFKATIGVITAILDIIIGIMLLTNVYAGIITLTWLFAIWFFIDSVTELINSGHLRQFGLFYMILSIIFDILGIVVSLLMFMDPVVSAITLNALVAFYLAVFGINYMLIAFARRQ